MSTATTLVAVLANEDQGEAPSGEDTAVERVAVVGPGGAGKSRFAEELGQRTGIPVVHLDQHYWKPGWIKTPKEEWHRIQGELVAGDRWILDGNYGASFDLRFERADTVIVIQPSRIVCLAGALRRSLRNRGAAVQAPGCPERLDPGFLRWIWRYSRDSRHRLDEALGRYGELEIIELRSRRDARSFLRRAGSPRS